VPSTEDVTLSLDLFDQVCVEPVQLRLVVDAVRVAPERDHAERGGRDQFELRGSGDLLLRVLRQVQAVLDRGAERGDTEVADGHPQLQGSAATGELEAEV
jgi:hypothetical protein